MHIGEQPLGPVGGSPANQPGPQDIAMSDVGQAPEVMQPAPGVPDISLPQPASPPAPFENNPVTAQEMLPQS